jgi:N4-gp56 family major capsid protein
MPVNYALKYAPIVDKRFALGALSGSVINNNFDWIGVETVRIFSRDLVTLGDYTVTGANRYGTPDELGNDVQEMQLTQDKAFTYTIDRKSEQDTNGTMEAAATLAENIDNVLIPAIDKYRFAKIAAAAPAAGSVSGVSHIITAATTASNAYEEFLKGQEILDNDLAPNGGRIAIVSPKFYNLIKLDESFVKRGDMATRIAINGVVGEIDGVPIVKVPASYLPANVDYIITNPVSTVAPVKLQDFKIHVDPPGINGCLVECRLRHDAFILNKKKDAIVVHKAPTT